MNSNITTEEELRLADIVQFLIDGKRWIFLTTVFCAILGTVYAFLAPEKYEASASIEMATVTGNAVETPALLTEKLKLPLFYSSATFKACQTENMLPSPGQVLVNQLTPAVNKASPMVSFKFRGKSASQAKQCLESVLVDIKKSQALLAQPLLDRTKSQLHLLQQKLDEAEKLAALLPVNSTKLNFNDPKFSATALLLATSVIKGNEIKDLRTQINDLQSSLLPPQTRETSLVTPIYAPDTKVEPRKTLIILNSALAGIFLGLLFYVMRRFLFTGRQTVSKA